MRRLVIALAAVVAMGAVAAVAVASSGAAVTGACYDTKTGTVRVDVDGTGCKAKEAPFTFGTTTRLVSTTVDLVPAGDYRAAFAACAAGEVVVGGGFVTPTIHPDVRPFMDTPMEIEGVQGWYVVVINESPVDIDFTASAVCTPGTATGY